MSYATATTLLILLPGLPQTSSSMGYSNTVSRIEQHITRADNIINGMIAKRYVISNFISSVPPLLKTLSEDITSYFTYRSFFSMDNQNRNEWTDKFEGAIDILREIRDNKMDLVDSSGNVIAELLSATTNYVDSNTKDYASTFAEDTSTSWSVDNDKIDSISDDRD